MLTTRDCYFEVSIFVSKMEADQTDDRVVIARVLECLAMAAEDGLGKLMVGASRSVRVVEHVQLVRDAARSDAEELQRIETRVLCEALKELVDGLEPKLLPPAAKQAFKEVAAVAHEAGQRQVFALLAESIAPESAALVHPLLQLLAASVGPKSSARAVASVRGVRGAGIGG